MISYMTTVYGMAAKEVMSESFAYAALLISSRNSDLTGFLAVCMRSENQKLCN
jgi:hypothetical protein